MISLSSGMLGAVDFPSGLETRPVRVRCLDSLQNQNIFASRAQEFCLFTSTELQRPQSKDLGVS